MKQLLLFLFGCLFQAGIIFGQPGPEEIGKHGIRKVLIRTTDNTGVREETRWYSSRGHDSIHIFNGVPLFIKNETRDNRLEKQVYVNAAGDTTDIYQFVYERTGHFRKTHLGSDGRVIRESRYNKKGQLLESETAEGLVTLYAYDPQGRLSTVSIRRAIKTYKDKKNNSPMTMEKYYYGPDGLLDRCEKEGSSTRYTYHAGLLVREVQQNSWQGNTFSVMTEYWYNHRGLLEKSEVKRLHGEDPSVAIPETVIEYDYEFYN